jgi:hypothetical protein
MQPVYKGHEFEVLKLQNEAHVSLLRTLTDTDLRIFTGYITLQILLGGWLSENPVHTWTLKIGLLLIDLTLSGIAGILLYNNYRRRREVVAILQNLNEALGLNVPDLYLPGKALNAPTTFRPWWPSYLVGIIIT